MGSRVTFLPANFQPAMSFRSRLRLRHGTDRQTTAFNALRPNPMGGGGGDIIIIMLLRACGWSVDSGGLPAGTGVGRVERVRRAMWSWRASAAQAGAPAGTQRRRQVRPDAAEDSLPRVQLQGRSGAARLPWTQRYAPTAFKFPSVLTVVGLAVSPPPPPCSAVVSLL